MPARKEITWEVDENGCHNCTSHPKNEEGYARFKRFGRNWFVHRFVYFSFHGEIPEGMVIRHKCDNPSCINIEHLEIGTHTDNVHDCVERGRHRHGEFGDQSGENNPHAKITEEDVRAIRADLTTPNTHLAKKYGITHSNVSLIRLCKSWKHVI